MDELKAIRSFVKVVEAGSFAEAARQENIAKSVITKRINQLETHMEMELLQRSTRRMSVTDTGANFYERCLRVLNELDSAKAAVSSMEWGLTGKFRVSCISSFTAPYLARDLCEFRREHPGLQIELQQHDRFCDPVQEGFDVCIQPGPIPSGTLEAIEVVPLRRLMVAGKSFVEKYGMPATPAEIVNYPIALNNHVTPDLKIQFSQDGKFSEVPIEPVMLTNTIWLLREAILGGDCISMMPLFFIENELLSGDMVPLLTTHEVRSTAIRAYFRQSSFVPIKVRIFINFLRRKYGSTPPWERRVLDAMPELGIALGRKTEVTSG